VQTVTTDEKVNYVTLRYVHVDESDVTLLTFVTWCRSVVSRASQLMHLFLYDTDEINANVGRRI